ncbi:DUF1840 domain-containing protein [Pararobbsia silviterrae]|uniref:DUF1840 domain-containing protein n=1 Tax=Pararobbsia silviterrae TaxID=1792498 RepID=A0A494YC64_9BURK|nr:DUF1840 domain-containing protein [Pararobbsia silviterrae]RKP59380.1 DUF1840 domain-containing protein [Pararobbsia silviterrae]
MLITFKSAAAPEVIMLDNLAQYLLGIIGKHLGERGVITHHELPGAIEKLEAAIVVDKDAEAHHEALHHHDERKHHEMPVGLAQRAFPFLDMLRASLRENADIIWGV